jgi:hypothetical protein
VSTDFFLNEMPVKPIMEQADKRIHSHEFSLKVAKYQPNLVSHSKEVQHQGSN